MMTVSSNLLCGLLVAWSGEDLTCSESALGKFKAHHWLGLAKAGGLLA